MCTCRNGAYDVILGGRLWRHTTSRVSAEPHGNSGTVLKYRNKALNKGIREELNQDRGY